MCYSETMSLVAFLLGIAGSTLVYTLGAPADRIIALTMGYISFIQIIEWLLWRHPVCDTYHKQISIAGMWINGLQPVILGVLTLLLSPRTTYKPIVLGIVLFYLVFALKYCDQYSPGLQCTTQRPKDPHLVWNWLIMPSYQIMWILFITSVSLIGIFGMPTLSSGIFIAASFIVSMITSMIVYPRQDVGSMWCFFAFLISPTYYMLRINKIL